MVITYEIRNKSYIVKPKGHDIQTYCELDCHSAIQSLFGIGSATIIVKDFKDYLEEIKKYISDDRLFYSYGTITQSRMAGYPDVKQTCFYYHIIASLDKIVDILKYNARDAIKYKKKFNSNTIDIWKQISKSIKGYYDLFYKFEKSV